jgi:putative transposase
VARFVWNWALAEWNRQYEAGEKPTALKLKNQFNEIRRAQFPWTWDGTKNASDQPFLDLGKAFTVFFEGKARRPKFKSKKRRKPSFYLANDQVELSDHQVWIPKLGWVNMAENLRLQGKITGARVTRTADWWFISITVEVPDAQPTRHPAAIGIDVGLNRLATLSTGEQYENQAFLKTALKKLRQANKRLHRRVKGSKNREKARRKAGTPPLSRDLYARRCASPADHPARFLLWDHWYRRPQPQRDAQEPAPISFVFGCGMRQTPASAHKQGRAARGASGQDRALLSLKQDVSWLRVEVGRDGVV